MIENGAAIKAIKAFGVNKFHFSNQTKWRQYLQKKPKIVS